MRTPLAEQPDRRPALEDGEEHAAGARGEQQEVAPAQPPAGAGPKGPTGAAAGAAGGCLGRWRFCFLSKAQANGSVPAGGSGSQIRWTHPRNGGRASARLDSGQG